MYCLTNLIRASKICYPEEVAALSRCNSLHDRSLRGYSIQRQHWWDARCCLFILSASRRATDTALWRVQRGDALAAPPQHRTQLACTCVNVDLSALHSA